jgi:hypothetical protein
VAFLVRRALVTGFRQGETIGLAAVAALFLIMPFLDVPVGLMTAAILGFLIARRVFLHEPACVRVPPEPLLA